VVKSGVERRLYWLLHLCFTSFKPGLLCLLSCLLFALPNFAQSLPNLSQESLATQGMVLNQGWQYHAGDTSFVEIQRLPKANWEALTSSQWLAGQFPRQGWRGVAWLQLKVAVSPDLVGVPLALQIKALGASEIYMNDQLLHRYGEISPQRTVSWNPQGQPLTIIFQRAGPQTLWVRYACPAIRGDLGDWLSNWWATESNSVSALPMGISISLAPLQPTLENYQKEQLESLSQLTGFLGFLGAFILLQGALYLLYPEEKSNLFISLMAGGLVLGRFTLFQILHGNWGPEAIVGFRILNACGVAISTSSYLFLVCIICIQQLPRWSWWLVGAFVINQSLRFLPGFSIYSTVYMFLFISQLVATLSLLFQAIMRRDKEIGLPSFAILFISYTYLVEIFKTMGIISITLTWDLLLIGFICCFLSLSFYLARQAAQTSKTLVQLNSSLDQKIIERTEELSHINQSLIQEIQQRKQIELSLKASEQRFQLVAQATSNIIWDWNLETNSIWFNNGYEDYLGYQQDSESGIDLDWWKQKIHPNDQEAVLSYFRTALESALDNFMFEYRFRKADGTYIPIEDRGSIIRNSQSQPIRVFGAMRDLTLSQEAEQLKQEAIKQQLTLESTVQRKQELESLNRLKDEFLGSISHELRTPLNNMYMAINMIKRNKNPARSEVYFAILENEYKREKELVNDLLNLQSIQMGTVELNPERMVLAQWLPQIIAPFIERTKSRDQQLNLSFNTIQTEYIGDPLSLERILRELLNNACKYTPPSGQIAVTCALDEQELKLKVANSGPAIPQAALPHIFDKFYRVPKGDPWQQGGTGLGLHLIQLLVQNLEGRITVTSREGETCFTVTLPQKTLVLED